MSDKSSFDKSRFTGFDIVAPATHTYLYNQIISNPYSIKILDSSCNYLGYIGKYRYFGWTRRLYEPDGWSFELRADQTYSNYLTLNNFILWNDSGTNRIGRIEDLSYTQNKTEYKLIAQGRDPTGLLYNRVALYGTDSGTGYDDQSGNAETVIQHYINVNCLNSTDTSRNYTGLELLADEGRGEEVSYSARFEVIGDIVSSLLQAGELGKTTYFDKDECKTYIQFIESTDHSYLSSDPVIFKNKFNNIVSIQINKTNVNSYNLAYVGDELEDASRNVYEIYTISSEPSGNERVEIFVDGADCSTEAECKTLGQSTIIENNTTDSVSCELNPDMTFTYGEDYDLGDIVSLEFEDTIYDLQIVEIKLEFDTDNRRKITLTLGKPLRSWNKSVSQKTRLSATARK